MGNDLNRSIKIFIDGTPAAQGIAPVEAAIQKLEAKLASLNKSEANYQEESKRLKKEIEAKNRTLQNYKQKVEETDRVLKNLSGATYNELIAVQSQVRKQLREAVPGTEKHTRALEHNRRVSEAVIRAQREMRVEVGCQGTAFGRAANFVNKYFGLFSTAIASVTGLSMTMRKSVDDYAQISEAMAGVKKYTGMTDEEVKNLNEDLKKIDTRTPRERLNELAQDAGRLGITGKQDILDFVDAADKINVALGEDLGEDAVKNIGKLAQMFGEDKTLGLRGAMLATGSAINEVAQNSSASEQYLVDFTARVAGTGKQAGISQTQIMGFASVLDQDMQQVEMASTALQTVIMKVYQEPAKFAKMAGRDVKEFTDLLKKDANEAIIQLLENLGNKGGLQQLAPLFKDMKLDGVRAAGVLNTLAANTTRIREEQERATKAYHDGTSVIKEFNVQNNTVQAKLDKARNGFKEVSYQLGEKLMPLMSSTITITSSLIKVLNTLIGFISRHASVLTPLCATIAGYILLCKAQIIEEKLKVFWTEKVIVGLKKLYTIMLRNPYLAVAATIITFISAIKNMNKELTLSERISNRLSDIKQQAISDTAQEKAELLQLLSITRDENRSKTEREAAIKRINELSPEYLGNLNLENINTQEATKAVNKYIDSLIILSEVKAAQDKIDELKRAKADIQKNGVEYSFIENLEGSVAKNISFLTESLHMIPNEWATLVLDAYANKGKRAVMDIDVEISALNKNIEEGRQKLIALEGDKKGKIVKPKTNNTDEGDDDEKEKARKAALNKEKILYDQQQADIKKIYVEGHNEDLKTEKQYEAKMLDLKTEHFKRIINIAGKGSSEAADAEKQLADMQIEEKKKAVQRAIDQEKELYEQQQHNLKEAYINQNDENLKTQEDYEEAKEQLAIMHLQRSLEIAGLDADARKQIEEQLLEFKLKCLKEDQEAQKKAEKEKLRSATDASQKQQEEYKQRINTYKQYGEQVGTALGNILSGQENAMASFADSMIDIVFDVLEKIVEAEIIKATASATASVARASAEAYAMPDSVATFGASGAARAAILSGLIMGALAVAKTALKGLIGGKNTSSNSSENEESKPTANVTVRQWASGNYDVIGKEDGKTYRNTPYIGPAPTGIVNRTALISETGAELIVNAEDLARLQRHINYPLVVSAIQDARSGKVPQRVTGNYDVIENTEPISANSSGNNSNQPEYTNKLVTEIKALIITLKNLRAYVVLRDIQRAEELDERAKKAFTKSKK